MNRITLSVSVLLISLNCYAVVGIPVEESVKDNRKEPVKELTAEEKAEKTFQDESDTILTEETTSKCEVEINDSDEAITVAESFLQDNSTGPFNFLREEKQLIYNDLIDDRDLKMKIMQKCKSDLKNE